MSLSSNPIKHGTYLPKCVNIDLEVKNPSDLFLQPLKLDPQLGPNNIGASTGIQYWELIIDDNMRDKKRYENNEVVLFEFPYAGSISVNNKGVINYGGFNHNIKLWVNVIFVNSSFLYTFQINVIGGIPDFVRGYDPTELNVDLSVNNPSLPISSELQFDGIIKLKEWIINIKPNTKLAAGDIVKLDSPNTGSFTVDSEGKVTVSDMNNPGQFVISSNIDRFGDFILPINVINSSTVSNYNPNVKKITSPNPSVSETAHLVGVTENFKIDSWSVNSENLNVGDIFTDNGATISIDDKGTITYSGLSNLNGNKVYSIKANGNNSKIYIYTIQVLSSPIPTNKYSYNPDNIIVKLNTSGSQNITGGDGSLVVNHWKVNDGDNRNSGTEYSVETGGTISVGSKGTISYENFNEKDVYKITVNINSDENLTFTINAGGVKKYFGLELWEIIVIIVAAVIFIIVIIVMIVIFTKKKPEESGYYVEENYEYPNGEEF